jgi:hypothetical protein
VSPRPIIKTKPKNLKIVKSYFKKRVCVLYLAVLLRPIVAPQDACYYWESVVMARKFLIVFVIVFMAAVGTDYQASDTYTHTHRERERRYPTARAS